MKYANLINQPRPVSSRPKMSAVDRAAQFSAFAALVGLDEQMVETARRVDSKVELSEEESEILNRKIQFLSQKLNEDEGYPTIKVSYFVPDSRKDGGSYITKIGAAKRIDDVFCKILFVDGTEISVLDILDLEVMD